MPSAKTSEPAVSSTVRREALGELEEHRLLVDDRAAEIAVEQPFEIEPQLHEPRLVEPETAPQRRDLDRSRVIAEPDRDRIARDGVQEREARDRDRDEDRDEPDAAPDDEVDHGLRADRAHREHRRLRVEIQRLTDREPAPIALEHRREPRRAAEMLEEGRRTARACRSRNVISAWRRSRCP